MSSRRYCARKRALELFVVVSFNEIDLSSDRVGQNYMENRGYRTFSYLKGSVEFEGYNMPEMKSAFGLA